MIREYVEKFNSEHEPLYVNAVSDAEAADWMEKNVPHLECSDKQIEETYYFRWWTYRKHIKSTPEGYVITEFLPQVPWSGKYNAIACPAAHHVNEGRWLNNREYIKDDIRHFLRNTGDALHYQNSLLHSAGMYCLMASDWEFAEEILPQMKAQYAEWDKAHLKDNGLYSCIADRDGMEYSIGGDGFRPTLSSYMYGAATVIARLCERLGDKDAVIYRSKAETLRELINDTLWKDGFYTTLHEDGSYADVMEEVGFVPWCFDGLADEDKESAYRFLTDESIFLAPYGITTADMRHPKFMKNPVRHECLWDGPVWPYATSQTLTGIYTLLSKKDSAYIKAADYMRLLSQYAKSHKLYKDGKVINWIDENIEPFTGQWISRDLILLDHVYADKFPKERGADYNHSTFCDLVLSGACGIKIEEGKITIKPLCIGTWDSFRVDNIEVGKDVFAVSYDGNKLTLSKNGKTVCEGNEKLEYTI